MELSNTVKTHNNPSISPSFNNIAINKSFDPRLSTTDFSLLRSCFFKSKHQRAQRCMPHLRHGLASKEAWFGLHQIASIDRLDECGNTFQETLGFFSLGEMRDLILKKHEKKHIPILGKTPIDGLNLNPNLWLVVFCLSDKWELPSRRSPFWELPGHRLERLLWRLKIQTARKPCFSVTNPNSAHWWSKTNAMNMPWTPEEYSFVWTSLN